MIGERVAVLVPTRAGEDAMGDEVLSWGPPAVVAGCLVRPLPGSDSSDPSRPHGDVSSYEVAFPKAYTATAPSLRGARLALLDRGMAASEPSSALVVEGCPDRTIPCPTKWDMVVRASASHG